MLRRSQNVHERFLRHIWSRQYLKADLFTTAGRPLKVIETGRLNPDGGPDFLNAKIKINATTYMGDVEIHRTVLDWIRHQHQEDPHYNKVILHVVLEKKHDEPATFVHSGRQVPVLVLEDFLPVSIHTVWQKAILDERAYKSGAIRCYGANKRLSSEFMDSCLSKLAAERFELKLRRLDERIRQLAHENRMSVREMPFLYGRFPTEGSHDEIPPPLPDLTQKDLANKELWEQVLYEGIMEGLGYSKNREPFLKLAQNITLRRIRDFKMANQDKMMESLFFGTAGLIPKIKSLNEKESREYARRIAHEWRALKPTVRFERLNPADWQFFPTRPANFPTIRIAAACLLINKILKEDLFRCAIQAMKSDSSISKKINMLTELFRIEADHYWQNHYSFDKRKSNKIKILGSNRSLEIITNTILPVAHLYSRIFKDKGVHDGVIEAYKNLPANEDNSITRVMKKQFIRNKLKLDTINRQQAVIQLYKYYCMEGRCSDCRIGQAVFK